MKDRLRKRRQSRVIPIRYVRAKIVRQIRATGFTDESLAAAWVLAEAVKPLIDMLTRDTEE